MEPLILPAYKGSTLRGAFGSAFRRVVCVMRDKECADCLLKGKCVYSYVFETPPPAGTRMMRKYEAAPHPFVIEPPPERKRAYKPGEELAFGLVLVGRAIDFLPYFIYTFDELGRTGIGAGRGRFHLAAVRCQEADETIYDGQSKILTTFGVADLPLEADGEGQAGNGRLELTFLTPTRIVYDESLTMDVQFHVLVRNLLRRLSLLYYFHSDGDPSAWDFKGLIEKAKDVRVAESHLRWYDWERYSGRQERKVRMGGFVGSVTFEGPFAPFMPLISAGEVVHVGKGTTFGLGRYGANAEAAGTSCISTG